MSNSVDREKSGLVVGMDRVKQALVEPLIVIKEFHKSAWEEYGPLRTSLVEGSFLLTPPTLMGISFAVHNPFLFLLSSIVAAAEPAGVFLLYLEMKMNSPNEIQEALKYHRLGYQPRQLRLFK